MLIPPRPVEKWVTVSGTRTTFASVVSVLVNAGPFEAGMASVMIAYPASERSDPVRQGVRLDFRWVIQLQFTSFSAPDPGEASGVDSVDTPYALSVLDASPLAAEFTARYSDPENWEPVFGDRRPAEVIRHFHIAFDDFGSYDLLAVDCVARTFSLSSDERHPWDPGATMLERASDQGLRESRLLADAMAIAPLPPVLNYPPEDGLSQR